MFLTSSLATTLATAAPKGGVTVDVDATALWPVVILIVLVLALRPLLFNPMLRLFEERERRIEGAKLAARKMDEASAGALTKYETEMKKARTAGNVEKEQLRAEGLKAENEIVGKVREATGKKMAEGRKEILESAEKARLQLKSEGPALARAMASRVLGREVGG
jgi:F-type H+-transporting ATPase subunit b